MTDEQKQQIIVLRRDGAGDGRIAAQLQISINTVKSFCRRHSLAANTAGAVCEQCGRPIEQNPGRKRVVSRFFRKFISSASKYRNQIYGFSSSFGCSISILNRCSMSI